MPEDSLAVLDLLQEAHDCIAEFLEVDECRCDQMVGDEGEDLGPCAKCTAEDLLTRITMHLEPPSRDNGDAEPGRTND